MLDYIFLVIGVIVTIPVLYYFMAKGKAGKSTVVMVASGFFIALAGVYVQNRFEFYYVALAMVGLSFAVSVLIANRLTTEEANQDVEDLAYEPVSLEGNTFGGGRELVLPGSASIKPPSRAEDAASEDLLYVEPEETEVDASIMRSKEEPLGADEIEPLDLDYITELEEVNEIDQDKLDVDEEDILDKRELESWLEERPSPKLAQEGSEGTEVLREEDPFNLLTEDDWIQEEEGEDDGKK